MKKQWVNGRFLMSKYSNDGHKLNHEILSPCTKSLVRKNLASPTRIACLIKVISKTKKRPKLKGRRNVYSVR